MIFLWRGIDIEIESMRELSLTPSLRNLIIERAFLFRPALSLALFLKS